MTSFAADLIGICGSLLFIGAFIYANRAPTLNKLLFNAVNLAGAVLLLISLSVNFNLAAVILEVAWGIIAAVGMIRALRTPRS
jgi:hypothetical protein